MCGNCARFCVHMCTYYVLITLVVVFWIGSPLNIRAISKSEIFGFISQSRRTFLVLRSLCIILNLESWWRYKIPQAIPIMISKHFPQLSNELLVWSTIKFNSRILKIWLNSVKIFGCMQYKYILWTYIIKENKTDECNRFIERRCTKNEEVQAFVGQVLINQHLFFPLNATAKKLDKIPMLKFCN